MIMYHFDKILIKYFLYILGNWVSLKIKNNKYD